MERKIIHLDMDAFYASVEQADHPELRGQPVIVGGTVERGVVSACSYQARTFGVHSAMPMARALRLCPQAAVMPVRMGRYRELSAQIFVIFNRFTDTVEPLSIDEAFLDITGSQRLFGTAAVIAEKIRQAVRLETGLTVSAGIAPNKFLAKLASEVGKPDGLTEVLPSAVDAFLLPLPLSRLWGVGQVTGKRLARHGLHTVEDLRGVTQDRLVRWFGSYGEQLYRLARGEDERPVRAPAEIKSVGHEETFRLDVREVRTLRLELLAMAEKVAGRLRAKGLTGKGITIKVKYADFTTITRSGTLLGATAHAGDIFRRAEELLKKTEAGTRPIRLLGVSVSRLVPQESEQGELFTEKNRRQEKLDEAVDRLRARYGGEGISRASLLEKRLERLEREKRGEPGKGP